MYQWMKSWILLNHFLKPVSSAQSWIREIAMCVTLEKITYVITGKVQEFEEVWSP